MDFGCRPLLAAASSGSWARSCSSSWRLARGSCSCSSSFSAKRYLCENIKHQQCSGTLSARLPPQSHICIASTETADLNQARSTSSLLRHSLLWPPKYWRFSHDTRAHLLPVFRIMSLKSKGNLVLYAMQSDTTSLHLRMIQGTGGDYGHLSCWPELSSRSVKIVVPVRHTGVQGPAGVDNASAPQKITVPSLAGLP